MVKSYPYPLGLPKGTVRAIITLLFLFTTLILVFQEKIIPRTLVTIDLILISFYYGMRKGIPPLKETLKHDEIEEINKIEGQTAFNLPAKTVRAIILLTILILIAKILILGSETYPELLEFLITVLFMIIGYATGGIFSKITKHFRDKEHDPNKIIFHGKAIVVLALCIVTNIFFLFEFAIPQLQTLEFLTILVIGFYFGNRIY